MFVGTRLVLAPRPPSCFTLRFLPPHVMLSLAMRSHFYAVRGIRILLPERRRGEAKTTSVEKSVQRWSTGWKPSSAVRRCIAEDLYTRNDGASTPFGILPSTAGRALTTENSNARVCRPRIRQSTVIYPRIDASQVLHNVPIAAQVFLPYPSTI
jgi:hypothetical protein